MKGLSASVVVLATLLSPVFAKVELSRYVPSHQVFTQSSRTPVVIFGRTINPPRVVPNKVIVELETAGALGTRDEPVDVHARFLEELDRRLPADSFRIRKQFSSPVFTGASIEVSSIEDLEALEETPGVKKVSPVMVVRRPEFKPTAAPQLTASPDLYPPNIMTGVDKAHAAGITGKGIKIGM